MEKETRTCPICGESIDLHAQICPICGEPTGFPLEDSSQSDPVKETIVETPDPTPETPSAIPPPTPEATTPPSSVVPPPIPEATTPPPIPPAAPPVVEQGKQSSWAWIAFTLLSLAIIGAGIYFLFFKDSKANTQESVPIVSVAEKTAVEVLDSIKRELPPGAQEVLRVNAGDAPCLFFLNNGHFHRFDAKEKQTIEVELPKLNPEASVDILKGGVIKATPTPDNKDILLVVTPRDAERALYKYNVEGSRVDILGKGIIEEYGSGYIIRGANNERHIDDTGNITREFDPGLPEELQTQEQETKPAPAKPKPQPTTPKQTEPEPEPTPSEPAEPAENTGTGFHLEPV